MRSPVELEEPSGSRNRLAIEGLEYFLGRLPVGELNESVAHWLVFDLVADELHIGDSGYVFELISYVLLVHPGLNVANPKRSALGGILTLSSRIAIGIILRVVTAVLHFNKLVITNFSL